MKKNWRIVTLVLALTLLFTMCPTTSLFAAAEGTAPDTSEFVTLSMYLIGDPAPDYATMLEKLNEKLEKDINAHVEISWLSRGNYQELYTLLLASGEPVDAIFAGTWTQFYQEAAKGAFLDITELAPIYMPKTYAQWTDDIKSQVTINGKIYGIPNLYFNFNQMGYIIRSDIAEEIGFDKEIKNLDDYGEFLKLVAEKRPDMAGGAFAANVDGLIPYFARENGYAYFPSWPPFTMDVRTGEMICIFDHPEILDFFKKMKDWNEMNTWSKSVLSDTSQNHYMEGRSASWMHNADSWVQVSVANPSVDHLFYMTVPYTTQHRAMQDGQAIPASAKNPERALMMFESFFQDKEYWMMLAYGVEGIHYDITESGELNPLNTDLWAPNTYCDWGLQRVEWKLPVIGQPKNSAEVWDGLASMGELNPYAVFFADFEPIRNERAAVVEVYNQYAYPLAYGFVEDVEAGYAELMQKLEEAGLRTMEAELQRQLEAYKVANNLS